MGPFDFARAAITPGEKGITITNMYMTRVSRMGGVIVRLETNKGITGYGECRDLDSESVFWLRTFAPHIIGMNPTQIENVYDTMLKVWTEPSRMANQEQEGTGAISGIEMACWDITGKVNNVPVCELLGPKLPDKIPMYADTDSDSRAAVESRVEKGFKLFKCDMYLSRVAREGYTLSWTPNNYGYQELRFNQAVLDQMHEYMEEYRDTLKEFGEPYASAPIASDHYQGYNQERYQISVESAIALTNDLAAHNMGGWIEDIIDWWVDDCSGAPLKEIVDATTSDVVICTGEDMFGLDQFKSFADIGAVRLFHPEVNTAGGFNQTLLAAKYAHSKGIKTALHNSSGPIAMAGYAHVAAAIPDFVALEYHQMDRPWHDDLVDGIDKPMIQDGMMNVPEGPGVGVVPNEANMTAHGHLRWFPAIQNSCTPYCLSQNRDRHLEGGSQSRSWDGVCPPYCLSMRGCCHAHQTNNRDLSGNGCRGKLRDAVVRGHAAGIGIH